MGHLHNDDRVLAVLGLGLVSRFSFLDLPKGGLLASREALGVYAEQNRDAVASPLGDPGGLDAGVEPRGQAGVPEVIGALAQRRGRLGL
jgi:hypothetical protein